MNGYRRLPHIVIPADGHRRTFRNPVGGGGGGLPNRDRYQHAEQLRTQYERAKDAALSWLRERDWQTVAEGPAGIYLEILTAAYVPEVFEDERYGIEVVAAVPDDERPGVTRVTVFIPAEQVQFFAQKLDRYRDEDTKKGNPKFQNFAARVEEFRFEDPLRALWTDPKSKYPIGPGEVWWEVWVRAGLEETFIAASHRLNLDFRPGLLSFPSRTVRLVHATPEKIAKLILESGAVAELRAGITTPARLLRFAAEAQYDILEKLLSRTRYADEGAPSVCLLDTGINHEHPLLASAVASYLAYNPLWGTHDSEPHGHGTQMAGLALFGNLTPFIGGSDPIELTHRLESVKVLPDNEGEAPEPDLYGQVYRDSIHIVESTTRHRLRVFASAVTGAEEAWKGRPDSWSAQIDYDCFERGNERIFIIAAGNVDSSPVIYAPDYANDANDSTGILQPGQAWNAITVGAYTDLSDITDPKYAGYSPVAPAGGLCPQSRTSVLWEPQWPIKPDVVLEGGNYAKEASGENAHEIDDLMLLSTDPAPNNPFSTFGYTSGATALAGQISGQLLRHYPDLWPETIRGLAVHSAEWTNVMLTDYGTQEDDRRRFLGRYGYGVPRVERALWSLQHDLTMVVQDDIQPFKLVGSTAKTNNMILYDLPWPSDVLEPLGEADVQLRVTLSYYIEPNPARRGYKGRYLYASHGLRFEVKKANERIEDFAMRINRLEREDGYENPGGDDEWFLKANTRNRGSLIQDIWRGSAIDLAARSAVAIYPVTGWWKTVKKLGKVENRARFSLLVSLSVAGRPDVDIYTPVAVQIAPPVVTEIPIEDESAESEYDDDDA
jgi:hypothetical protein